MQIDATMISDQTNNKFMELEVLMEHTQVWTGTEGMVHSSGSMEKQALQIISQLLLEELTKYYPELVTKKNEVESQRKSISLGVLWNKLLPIT